MENKIQQYHSILELTFPATKSQIKKAFHRLAHVYHPDKKTGSEQKFKEINTAYQILMKDGYWSVIAEDRQKNPDKYKNKSSSKSYSPYKPSIMMSDDGKSFWMEDRDGFVTSYHGPLESMEEVVYRR